MEPDQVNQAILNFQQSKAFRTNKVGVINCSIGSVSETYLGMHN